MKKLCTIITCLCLLMLAAVTEAAWTKKDTAYQITYSVFHVMDWGQTRYIAKHPEKHSESNPYLGKHPSIGRVDTYFLATLAGHTLISIVLPEKVNLFNWEIKPRRLWQGIWIILEAGTVARNFGTGVRIAF